MHPRSGRRVRIVDDESKRGAARWSSAPGERRRDVRAVAGVFDRDRRSFFERRAGERERHTSPLMPRRCKREQDDEDAVLRRGRVPHERNIKPKTRGRGLHPGLDWSGRSGRRHFGRDLLHSTERRRSAGGDPVRRLSENGQAALKARGIGCISAAWTIPKRSRTRRSAMPRVPRHPRGLLVAVLLLGSLLLAGVLALQAHTNFLYHRATAERVLRDYARLAASRFALRTGSNLYYMAAWPPMEALSRAKAGTPGTPLPSPEQLEPGLQPYAVDFLKLARYTLRLDLATGRLETSGDAPSAAARRWLLDGLPAHARSVYQPKEHLAVIVEQVGGLRHAVIYTVKEKAGAPSTLVGVDVDPKAFEPFYTMGAEKQPLLPRPLTGGIVFDSMVSVIVTEANGAELYRSPVQYPATFSARDTVEAMMGGMQVHVALRPEMASKLVIGGLPRSRLPVLLGVLARSEERRVGKECRSRWSPRQ